MSKSSTPIIKELVWLLISMAITIALSLSLFGMQLVSGTVEFHLHDTHFVVTTFPILLFLFLHITFFVFFINAHRHQFSRKISNYALVVLGISSVLMLTFAIKTFSSQFSEGWTLYPPLSSLGPDEIPRIHQDPVSAFFTHFFTVLQFLVLIFLLLGVYRWGARKNEKTNSYIK